MKKTIIGLFGYSSVGQGIYDILTQSVPSFEIKRIAIKHPEKKPNISTAIFTTDHDILINDPDIDIIVVAIDDAKASFEIATKTILKGKKFVTANKKMVADNFLALKELSDTHNSPLLYEAASCSSIPILKMLEMYYGYDLIEHIEGIYNSTTNYMLTRLHMGASSYDEVLRDAQSMGFAESDPSLDVSGADAKYKLCINIAHAFGMYIHPDNIYTFGIESITPSDIEFAKKSGQKIKLNAKAISINGDVSCWVMPTCVDDTNYLYNVEGEDNCIKLCPSYANEQLYVGKGAGGYPTGSAVVSDIFAARENYVYPYSKWNQGLLPEHTDDFFVTIYLRYLGESQIEDLKFARIEQKSVLRNAQKILTGVIKLQDLKKSKINSDKNVFLMDIGEK